MKKLKDNVLPIGTSTHIMLSSGNVKMFSLYHNGCEESLDLYHFGFKMKSNMIPEVILADEMDDNNEVYITLNKKGLESLIRFLNRLCEDDNENNSSTSTRFNCGAYIASNRHG